MNINGESIQFVIMEAAKCAAADILARPFGSIVERQNSNDRSTQIGKVIAQAAIAAAKEFENM